MVESAADLQQLKGIGKILAKRLYDAGFDSFAKISEAGEQGLGQVRGISPRTLASILEQARELSGRAGTGEPRGKEEVQRHLAEVRERVQAVAESARERFQEQLSGKSGKKLSADLVRLEDAFARMNDGGSKRLKRREKALGKAEKRVSGLEEANLKKIRKGLKRARKALLKAL